MKKIEYLLLLRNEFIMRKNNEEIKVTSKELSSILSTSDRNTIYLIKNFMFMNYLKWIPGKGRGNRSSLIFSLTFTEVASLYVKEMVTENKVKDVINFANSYLSEDGLHEIYRLLHQSLGPQIEIKDSELTSRIKLLIPQEISTLDPINVQLYSEAHLISQIYNTLVIFDEKQEKLLPSLAYDWQPKEGGKKWTFLLRKSVQFHSGDFLTSKDIAFTFNKLLNTPCSTIHSLIKDIKEVEILSDHIIRFHLTEVNYFFPRVISSFQCAILHHLYDHRDKPNGTGPFFVKKHDQQFIQLEAFQFYFQERALIDQVDIWMDKFSQQIPNNMSQLETTAIESKTEDITHHQQLLGSRFLIFNSVKKCPVLDKNLRLSLINLVNPTTMIKELGGNRISIANSFLPKISVNSKTKNFSIERAKNFLKESNYSGETLQLFYFHLNEGHETASWIKKQAEYIGLSININPISPEAIPKLQVNSHADFILFSSILSKDTELSLLTLFESEFSFIRPYLPKEVKKYIDNQLRFFKRSEDTNERYQSLLKIESYLKENLVLHFLYHSTNTLNYQSHVKGMEFNSYGLIDFKKIWIQPDFL
ncbi:ABC transporter substrate-binding protein [Metabacillus litoralis]|nr:ABC transporter substrate-binding protein [Metabacillus litoralis]